MTLIQSEPKKILMRQSSRLPSAYQEVEWIKASGTQYIAPGVTIEAGTKLKVDIDIYITGNGCIYGEFSGVNPETLYQIGIDNNNFFARIDNTTNGSLPTTWTPNTYTVNTRYRVVAEGTATYNQANTPVLLAQLDSGGTPSWFSSNQLYSAKIWKDNVLVRDLVPCYRIADSVIGMYDLVNNQFYTNAGSGTFTKGADTGGGNIEIQKIMMRPGGVEKQIRPVGWQPGANTLLYLPLESDVKDYSPNNRGTFSNSGTLGTKGGVNCRYCGTSGYIALGTSAYSYLKPSTNKATYSFWVYLDGYNSYNGRFFEFAVQYQIYVSFCRNGSSGYFRCVTQDGGGDKAANINVQIGTQQWVYITLVIENSNWYVYKNGTLIGTVTSMKNNGFGSWQQSYQQGCNIAGNRSATSSSDNESLNGGISHFIIENKARTAQEVAKYYNQTKGNYGL